MTKKRKWPLGVVLTGTHGITLCNFGDFQEFVEWLLGRPVWTHQLIMVEGQVKDEILRQHPQLRDFSVEGLGPDNYQDYLTRAEEQFGAGLELTPLTFEGTVDPYEGLPDHLDVIEVRN